MEDNTLIAVYDNSQDARDAATELIACGFPRGDVRLSSESDTTGTETTTTTQTGESGIGHFFRSLFGMEEDHELWDIYGESVRRGSFVLVVTARSDEQFKQASEIMSRHNPVEDIDERSAFWRSQGWTGYDDTASMMTSDEVARERASYALTRSSAAAVTTEEKRIPVIEEEMKVGKREVMRGGVRIFQRLTEKPVQEQVQLREEQVKVERRPVDQPASEADLAAFKEGSIELRETAEEPVVSKEARVVEEVVVGKEVRERTEAVADTVRGTEVDIENIGAKGTTQADMATQDTDFRTHWKTSYSSLGGRYEDYAQAYNYGSTLAANEKYKGHQWNDIEPELRADWEARNTGSPWEKTKEAVRYGWEKMTR